MQEELIQTTRKFREARAAQKNRQLAESASNPKDEHPKQPSPDPVSKLDPKEEKSDNSIASNLKEVFNEKCKNLSKQRALRQAFHYTYRNH